MPATVPRAQSGTSTASNFSEPRSLLNVTTLYLGVSMSVYQSSSSLAVQSRLEVIPINCIDNIVAIMLDPRQWLKCNGTLGNAVHPPPIYGSSVPPPQIVNL